MSRGRRPALAGVLLGALLALPGPGPVRAQAEAQGQTQTQPQARAAEDPRDLATLTAAAEAGEAAAQYALALRYHAGDGVPQDHERAAELFAAAAGQGMKAAYTNLGVMYENGFGVPRDEARAAELYRMGGQGADTPADRFAPVPDPRLRPTDTSPGGLARLDRALRAGDPVARFQAGILLLEGPEPGFADAAQAAALFRASAGSGYAPAMANLGLLHFRGLGLIQDYELGQMWLLLARAAGFAPAEGLIAAAAPLLTPAQITAARARAEAARRAASPADAGKDPVSDGGEKR